MAKLMPREGYFSKKMWYLSVLASENLNYELSCFNFKSTITLIILLITLIILT